MLDRKLKRALAAATVLSVCFLPMAADAESTPNGPWVTPEQNISLEAFSDYEELTERLIGIEASSNGLVEVEAIGTSGEGRSLWMAKIGDPGNTPVLIFTQQHGDEPHGTEAALELIQTLSTGSAAAKRILDHLFVLVIPRVNVDGAEIPTRGNADFTAPTINTGQCPAAGGSDPDGKGIYSTEFRETGVYSYDMNRYHWGDWTESWQYLCNVDENGDSLYPENPVPESLAVLGAYDDYGPIWAVDVHNQGFNVVDPDECAADQACRPGQYVTGSILWPTNDDVDPEALDLSKQMAIVMKKRSLEIGNVELTRYAGGGFAAIARNAYGLLGSERLETEPGPLGGSVLFEVSGQIEGDPNIYNNGQKAIGKLKSGVKKILMTLLEATADGSLFAEDPDEAETLILDNDVPLDNPRFGDE